MHELSNVEINEVSGGTPIAVAGAIIAVGTAILVAVGAVDGWQGEKKKQEQDKKKAE